jgi:hypothetical protein
MMVNSRNDADPFGFPSTILSIGWPDKKSSNEGPSLRLSRNLFLDDPEVEGEAVARQRLKNVSEHGVEVFKTGNTRMKLA